MKVYERITNLILQKLKEGHVPWHKPWSVNDWPRNFVSKRAYQGINVFILTATGYSLPYWLTYCQASKLGGTIKRGEKGTAIIYWKLLDVKDEDEEKQIPFLQSYTVFNVLQCEGIDIPEDENQKNQFEPLDKCENVIAHMPNKPVVEFGVARAFYDHSKDKINMPPRNLFEGTEEFYCTLFHEMIHSTGHPSRLNRKTLADATYYGSTNHTKEELIAEMGAAYLCGYCGIENRTIDNSAAYIKDWLRKLKDDKKLVIMAAAQAQRAFEFIVKTSNERL
jgi:antirestriction protein ArdC